MFLKLLATAYLLCSIIAIAMARAAIRDKSPRLFFMFLGLAMPFIFLYAAVRTLFSERRMIPYDGELARVEDEIEAERVRLFGGDVTCPSFSTQWEKAYKNYLRNLLQRATKTSAKIAEFGAHLGVVAR